MVAGSAFLVFSPVLASSAPGPAPGPGLLDPAAAAERALLGEGGARRAAGIALHAAGAVVLLLLALELGVARGAALAGGLFLALHPLAAEPLSSVAHRGTLRGTALFLGAAILWVRGRGRGSGMLLASSALVGALAYAAHPGMLGLPVLKLAADRLLLPARGRRPGPAAWVALSAVPATVALVGWGLALGREVPAVLGGTVSRMAAVPRICESLLVPVRLSAVYPDAGTASALRAALVAGVAALGLVVVWRLADRAPRLGFALVFAWLALAAGTVGPMPATGVPDRDLHLAAAAVALLVGLALDLASRRGTVPALATSAAASLFLVMLAAQGFARARLATDEIERYEDAVARHPGSPEAHALLGAAFVRGADTADASGAVPREERLERAVEHLSRALEGLPDDAAELRSETRRHLVEALASVGRTDRALELVESEIRWLEDRPGAPDADALLAEALRRKGRLLERSGDLEGAEGALRAALDRLDDAASAYELGRYLVERGAEREARERGAGGERVQEGIALLEQAQERDPALLDARLAEGRGWRAIRRYVDAVRTFEAAAESAPEAPGPRYELAVTYLDAGDAREASAQVMEALRIDPRHPASLLLLAAILRAQGRRDRADEAVENAWIVAPRREDVRRAWFEVLARQARGALARGELERAQELSREAAAIDAAPAEAEILAGEILARRKLWSDAVARYRRAFDLDPGDRTRRELAFAYKDAGYAFLIARDRDRAVAMFREAVELLPSEPEFEILYEIISNR